MSRSNLRIAIIVLTLATALIHLYLNIRIGHFDPPFTANAVGYLALLGVFLAQPPFLAGRERLFHYAYMGFAAVTILAWFFIAWLPGGRSDVLAYITKAIEVLLIIALWQHLQLIGKSHV